MMRASTWGARTRRVSMRCATEKEKEGGGEGLAWALHVACSKNDASSVSLSCPHNAIA